MLSVSRECVVYASSKRVILHSSDGDQMRGRKVIV